MGAGFQQHGFWWCQPALPYQVGGGGAAPSINARTAPSRGQGLTLVHLSAQRKRFLWDKGCFRGV